MHARYVAVSHVAVTWPFRDRARNSREENREVGRLSGSLRWVVVTVVDLGNSVATAGPLPPPT